MRHRHSEPVNHCQASASSFNNQPTIQQHHAQLVPKPPDGDRRDTWISRLARGTDGFSFEKMNPPRKARRSSRSDRDGWTILGHCHNAWGTRWDLDENEQRQVAGELRENGYAFFNTAWSPPMQAIEALSPEVSRRSASNSTTASWGCSLREPQRSRTANATTIAMNRISGHEDRLRHFRLRGRGTLRVRRAGLNRHQSFHRDGARRVVLLSG